MNNYTLKYVLIVITLIFLLTVNNGLLLKACLTQTIIRVNIKILDKIFMFLDVLKAENDFSICHSISLLLNFRFNIVCILNAAIQKTYVLPEGSTNKLNHDDYP